MHHASGTQIGRQAWVARRCMSEFNGILRRPHVPREEEIRMLIEQLGLKLPERAPSNEELEEECSFNEEASESEEEVEEDPCIEESVEHAVEEPPAVVEPSNESSSLSSFSVTNMLINIYMDPEHPLPSWQREPGWPSERNPWGCRGTGIPTQLPQKRCQLKQVTSDHGPAEPAGDGSGDSAKAHYSFRCAITSNK